MPLTKKGAKIKRKMAKHYGKKKGAIKGTHRYQWPDHIVTKRESENRPILTINKLPTLKNSIG